MNEDRKGQLKFVSKQLDNYLKENDLFNVRSRFGYNNRNDELLTFYLDEENKRYFLNAFSNIVDLNIEDFNFVEEIVADYLQNEKSNGENAYLFYDNNDVKTIKQVLLKLCQCVVLLELLRNYEVIDINDYKEDEPEENTSYYRGHSNKNWDLTPSMLRGLKEEAIIDKSFLIKKYEECVLLDKYNNRIEKFSKTECNNIYELTTFMQHSTSYSPLLDLTSEFDIAKSFALSNSESINTFSNIDSEIVKLIINNKDKIVTDLDEANRILRDDLRIFYLDKTKINFGSCFKIDDETIELNTFERIIKRLRPDFIIIDCKTNDRMKYQKGAFILFYNYLCFDDKIFYEFNYDFNIKAINIPTDKKRIVLDDLYRNKRYLDISHLMDPYLYFKE